MKVKVTNRKYNDAQLGMLVSQACAARIDKDWELYRAFKEDIWGMTPLMTQGDHEYMLSIAKKYGFASV
jgi:hypothetical protein